MTNTQYLIFALASSVIAIVYGLVLIKMILGRSAGSDRMKEIASAIQQGAQAYLNRQYKTIGIIAIVLFIILVFALGWATAIGFLVGAVLSAAAGYVGMNVSVRTNVRTTEAAKEGLGSALSITFSLKMPRKLRRTQK